MKQNEFRAKAQAFGGFLTAMVIPNMGAFIAWGLITALFIPTGWIPNENFSKLVGPIITYVLPLLLAYTGGKLIWDTRGAVAGVMGTVGLIVGSDIPMFLGAMIMGPLSAIIVKKFDKQIEGKIKPGFEMVVNNFSLGIISLILCMVSFSAIGPVILAANNVVITLINKLVETGLIPLLSIVNEVAKVLFLNNVIDQGIYYPLGMQQALVEGKSIFFMVASNPGSGLGLLLAFFMFGKGDAKKNAPSAIIIHFLGGIHEIYFPYVLMKPLMIIPMILGGASGTFTFLLFKVGLVAGPSPGSIISYLALTPRGNYIGVILGVLIATGVSFITSAVILKASKETSPEDEFKAFVKESAEMKKEGKDLLGETLAMESEKSLEDIKFIAFACDAGLGSSAMGASIFNKKLKAKNIDLKVLHFAIEKIPHDADMVVIHKSLVGRAKLALKDKRILSIDNYINDKNLNILLEDLEQLNLNKGVN